MARVAQPNPQEIFTNHPQRFPKAQAQAARFVQSLQEMMKKGPRSLVATVVDTSFHATQGYVLATTEMGIVHVSAVPIGSVVPQMRIYVRQQGSQGTNRRFLFDGYAPTLSSQNATGSLLYLTPTPGGAGQVLATTTASVATASSLTTSTGYFWCLFFYMPQLPSTMVTLLSMWAGSVSQAIALEMLPTGQLRFRSTNDGHGYITTNPVAPHAIHWVQIQPGLPVGQEFQVDGIANYTGLLSSSDDPTFGGGGANYTLLVLSDPSGNTPCPLGTWISRIGFGSSFSGGVVALPTSVPTDDSQLPALNASATQQTTALYLCNDTPGSATAANSAPAGAASALSLTSAYATVNALGPY